jgi:NAD(P)-dependent dehydrogenase (short-subunit alcohol dehydrogenase family)
MTAPAEQTLTGRVALITGASQGVGRTIATTYAAHGATVILAARTAASLEAVAAEIVAAGGRAHPLTCDVTDPAQVAALAAAASAIGPVDILVNNAGMAGSHKFITHPDELWMQIIEVNLNAVYRVTKAFAPQMVARGWGRIITIASIASRVGNRYMAAYTASKHGVLGLTRALAVELNPSNITVNAICPGYIDTPMTDATIENMARQTGRSAEESRAFLERLSPQNRLIAPEEVASVALMLAGEAARGITGQALNIDGGMIMS